MSSLGDYAVQLIQQVCPREGFGIDINAAVDAVLNNRPPRKRNDNFWPSSINSTYDCNRRQALSRVEKIWTDAKREDPKKVRAMEIGTALHALAQQRWLALTHRLYGHWRCPSCLGIRRTFCTLPEELCDGVVRVTYGHGLNEQTEERVCADEQRRLLDRGEPAWLYEEIRVKDNLGISGKVDGIFVRPDYYWYTIEIKTLEDLDFREMQEAPIQIDTGKYPALAKALSGINAVQPGWGYLPRNGHIIQAAVYTGIIMTACDAGDIPLDAAKYAGTLIIYLNRGTGQFRTFFRKNTAVEYERARTTVTQTRLVVASALALPETERRAHVFEKLPKSCSTRTDNKAVLCPWRTACFPYKNATRNVLTHL